MLAQNIAELAALLAKTDIAVLELTGPDVRLCLRNTPGGVVAADEPAVVADAPVKPKATHKKADATTE